MKALMLLITLLTSLLLLSNGVSAQAVTVELSIPALKVQPYHRPYVAVWLETPKRKGLHTLAVWHEKDDWLKDVRQWWRKLGRRNKDSYQAVTGATRRPGKYKISWDGTDSQGQKIPAGEYLLCIETAREAGGRYFYRQKIRLGGTEKQSYQVKSNTELVDIHISIEP